MKATGIVRGMDHLGRVVIPVELRRTLRISEGDPIEFLVDGNSVVIRKFNAVGDLEQLVEKLGRDLEAGKLLEPEMTHLLMEKVKEMQEILRKGR